MPKPCLGFLFVFNIFHFVFAKLAGESVISTKSYAIWRNATVPFYVNPSHFDHEQTTSILTALSVFAYKTCIKFKPVMARPFPTDEVMTFINPDGTRRCQIDTKGHSAFNPHLVKLGYECLQSPYIDMMIMRALGFPFEHNRDTRELYIDVLQENIEPGAIELFTKEDTLPLELRFLPYDINSVMHFNNREYSKNGHRTIIFKDPTVKQNRVGLTDTDLRKIEIVYGAECRARDRQEKFELCQSYPGVARRKRQADDLDVDNKDQTINPVKRRKRDNNAETVATKSLRVNPDITPPPENLTDDITKTLKELGIENEVEEIVEKVYKVSSLALKNAREKYCNNSKDTPPVLPIDVKDKAPRNDSDILGIIEVVADFARGMVDDAIKNLTKFCENSEAIEAYQRYHCDLSGRDPRCRMKYRSTHSGAVRYSTQHRPFIVQSTKHYGSEKARIQYGREGDATETQTEDTQPTTLSVRNKRELESTTETPKDEKSTTDVGKTSTVEVKFRADENNSSNNTTNDTTELTEMEKLVQLELKKDTEAPKINETQDKPIEEDKKTEADGNKVDVDEKKEDHKGDEKTGSLKSAEIIKINNKEVFRMGTVVPGSRGDHPFRRSHRYRANSEESSKELDDLDKILAKKLIDKKNHMGNSEKKYPKNQEIEETRNRIKEKTKRHHRNKKTQRVKHISVPLDHGEEDKIVSERYKQTEDQVRVEEVEVKRNKKKSKGKSKRDKLKNVVKFSADNPAEDEELAARSDESPEVKVKRPSKPRKQKVRPPMSEEPAELEEQAVPRTVTLTKKNEDFYNERRWPGGEVVYMIQVDTTYDISDMRQRLAEVKDILKEKTCASMREIKAEETEGYEDYIVIDDSPDYVTGRVGGKQRFGSIELFRGGQHRQHAAMMVMAMLGFYFEVSRHDRDKYIRVHMRHVRPDKLHHFEMIRSDATLPLPYDYASATHPAWQFWRQVGRTGISTVATFKQKDPDGSIMKSLGQNEKLLSDLDIVKINSIYGTECFGKSNVLRNKETANNRTEIVKIIPAQSVKIMLQKK